MRGLYGMPPEGQNEGESGNVDHPPKRHADRWVIEPQSAYRTCSSTRRRWVSRAGVVAKADPNMPKAFPRSAVALTTLVMLVMTLEEHRNEYSDYENVALPPPSLIMEQMWPPTEK